MKIPRWLNRCIICLTEPKVSCGLTFSEEHIIPKALGGRLTCDFLCKACNESFGRTFEAKAKSDPSIRLAIQKLSGELPELYASIENGQKHLIVTGAGSFLAYYKNGMVQSFGTKLDDGSLIVPDDGSEKRLKKMMIRDGLEMSEIERSLTIYQDAPFEEETKLTAEITVIKRKSSYGGPHLVGGNLIDPLLALKIAYEYSVLLMGEAALADQVQLNNVRKFLREGIIDAPSIKIERLQAEMFDPFHGIGFEGNKPHAIIQVRLFGQIAYRVHFIGLGFNIDPTYYTPNLKNGDERIRRHINPTHAAK